KKCKEWSTKRVIPDESKALSLLAPANAVAGLLPGGGLLPTPNPLASIGGVPLAALGGPALDPALAALGLPGSNMNSQSMTTDQLLKLMTSVDPKLNHMASGMNLNPGLKADSSSKEIEEAMKRVREAQSLISAAIEPGSECHSGRSWLQSCNAMTLLCHCRRHHDSDLHKLDFCFACEAAVSCGCNSLPHLVCFVICRHKKEKKKDKDREKERDRDQRSTSKKKKNKDKEKEREKKSDSEKGDVKVTRDYDEEEQGYDSEKEREEKRDSDLATSPRLKESVETAGEAVKEPKVNGDDHHEEDMDMSE
uniref:Serine and arginine rich splicing factor 11 n=1 Tax=Paramormyrops kingsleyae TaxID=1676925 RepID=A0A3B3QFH3_9TELE